MEPAIRKLLEKGEDPARIMEIVVQAFREAYPKALEESGNHLAQTLLARAPQLSEQRADLRAFRRRLARSWQEAFTIYEVVLTCCREAGAEFGTKHRRQAAKERDFVFEALMGLQARACLVAGETFELLKAGYPHGAHARCRTLHEQAVFAAVIAGNGQSVAERFLLHDAVENAATLETYQSKLAGRFGYESFSEEEIETIRDRKDAAIARFGNRFSGWYGWAADLFPTGKPTFERLEKLAGLGHLHPFYDWSTHLGVHAGSRGARLNVMKRGRQRFRLSVPTNVGLAEPGHGALISLMQVTTTMLVRGRPLTDDPEPLLISHALLELVDDAGDAFLAAHKRLEEKERRFQRGEQRPRAAARSTRKRNTP